jgi:hypothetical protein
MMPVGHSNQLTLRQFHRDATQVKAFSIVIGMVFLVWILILLFLKLYYGSSRVGCAAGGAIVDVAALKKEKIRRDPRKHRIARAWRIQVAFLGFSMGIPMFSFLVINQGLTPFIQSLDDVVEINNDIETRTRDATQITKALLDLHQEMQAKVPRLSLPTICPMIAQEGSRLGQVAHGLGLENATANIDLGIAQVDIFIEVYFGDIQQSLDRLSDASNSIDAGVESAQANDWILKLILMLLNVMNAFMVIGVLLSRNSLVYPAYHCVLMYFVVPVFFLALIGSMVATCVAMTAAVINAGTSILPSDLDATSSLRTDTGLPLRFVDLLPFVSNRLLRWWRIPGKSHGYASRRRSNIRLLTKQYLFPSSGILHRGMTTVVSPLL